MVYSPPSITSSGLTIPTYTDLVGQLVANAQAIYGADIYLSPDSQDYQWISAVSAIINDTNLLAQAVFNSRGPATATGTGLDVIVGANGLTRLPPIPSTCPVVVTGSANLTLVGAVVADVNGNNWSLPSPTLLGASGTATVTATCQVPGPISAPPGTITTIVTPTLGWAAVTNTVSATVGQNAETDAALRARQALSTAQPSQGLLVGLESAVAAVPGVTRFVVYENDASTANALGLPPNSVTVVVDGTPAQQAVAQAIWAQKVPGVLANGTTVVPVVDPYGVTTQIGFDFAQYVYLDVTVTLQPLSGYTVDTTTAIQQAVASLLNAAVVGSPVYISALWGAALSANPTPVSPAFAVVSVTAAVHLGATLSSALVAGTTYPSLSVSGLAQPVDSGATLILGTGSTTQAVTSSASASASAQTISVDSFVSNANYPVGTVVSLQQSASNLPIAYNQVAAGNASYVSVTTTT